MLNNVKEITVMYSTEDDTYKLIKGISFTSSDLKKITENANLANAPWGTIETEKTFKFYENNDEIYQFHLFYDFKALYDVMCGIKVTTLSNKTSNIMRRVGLWEIIINLSGKLKSYYANIGGGWNSLGFS
jgi:hypothetical protein